jgi:hypothetical protein
VGSWATWLINLVAADLLLSRRPRAARPAAPAPHAA